MGPEGLCEDIFHKSFEGPWDCSGDRAEGGQPEMLLQTGADRRKMPFLLTSFRAIVKRKALPKSRPRSRPADLDSIGERGPVMESEIAPAMKAPSVPSTDSNPLPISLIS